MGVHDKARLLALGLLPQGLMFKEDGSGRYLPFANVPFELEAIVMRWFMALPSTEQVTMAHSFDGRVKGLTPEGWEAFVVWMVRTLNAAQR